MVNDGEEPRVNGMLPWYQGAKRSRAVAGAFQDRGLGVRICGDDAIFFSNSIGPLRPVFPGKRTGLGVRESKEFLSKEVQGNLSPLGYNDALIGLQPLEYPRLAYAVVDRLCGKLGNA